MEHGDLASGANRGELAQAPQRVVRVAAQELPGLPDGAARPPVLVAPVRLLHRLTGNIEVEVCREPSGAGGAGEDDLGNVTLPGVEPLCGRQVGEQLVGVAVLLVVVDQAWVRG